MELAEQTLANLVEQRLKALNTNAFAFEKAHGFPADALRSVLRGGKKAGTAINRAQEICRALGLEFYVGPPRAEMQAAAPIDTAGFAHLPLVDARLAAGDGARNGDTEVLEHLAFREEWLRKQGLDPSQAVLARVHGDSMKPTLEQGDTILIDTSDAARRVEIRSRPPARSKVPIYAFRSGEDERVKRLLRPDPGTLIVLSDNPDWPPEIIAGQKLRQLELNIIGRVRWWGHTDRE